MEKCAICGFQCREYAEFRRCNRCGAIRTIYSYRPDLYGEQYAQTYLNYRQQPINISLNLFRLGLVSRWLKPGDKILDIGCCVGEFIKFAERWYDCYGFEPNAYARHHALKTVSNTHRILSTLNGEIPRVDLVTMFDVIEHLDNPAEFVRRLKMEYLCVGGIVVLTTPDIDVLRVDPKYPENLIRWKHWKPLEHLFLHTQASLEVIFHNAGFDQIHIGSEESDIRPGNPDGDIMTLAYRRRT